MTVDDDCWAVDDDDDDAVELFAGLFGLVAVVDEDVVVCEGGLWGCPMPPMVPTPRVPLPPPIVPRVDPKAALEAKGRDDNEDDDEVGGGCCPGGGMWERLERPDRFKRPVGGDDDDDGAVLLTACDDDDDDEVAADAPAVWPWLLVLLLLLNEEEEDAAAAAVALDSFLITGCLMAYLNPGF